MKVEVGYITSWRRAVFFSVVISVVIFGLVSTLSTSVLGAGILSNIIGVITLILCIIMFLMVLADKWNRYEGEGTAEVSDGVLVYKDKKRSFTVNIADIKRTDMEKITTGRESGKTLAYRLLIKTASKKYYIESDRALGRTCSEVDLYRLYIYINELTSATK